MCLACGCDGEHTQHHQRHCGAILASERAETGRAGSARHTDPQKVWLGCDCASLMCVSVSRVIAVRSAHNTVGGIAALSLRQSQRYPCARANRDRVRRQCSAHRTLRKYGLGVIVLVRCMCLCLACGRDGEHTQHCKRDCGAFLASEPTETGRAGSARHTDPQKVCRTYVCVVAIVLA